MKFLRMDSIFMPLLNSIQMQYGSKLIDEDTNTDTVISFDKDNSKKSSTEITIIPSEEILIKIPINKRFQKRKYDEHNTSIEDRLGNKKYRYIDDKNGNETNETIVIDGIDTGVPKYKKTNIYQIKIHNKMKLEYINESSFEVYVSNIEWYKNTRFYVNVLHIPYSAWKYRLSYKVYYICENRRLYEIVNNKLVPAIIFSKYHIKFQLWQIK